MKGHLLAAAVVAALALGVSLLAGPLARPALVGAAIATATGLASLYGFGRTGRSKSQPVERALLVFVLVFLARIVLVAAGVALVARSGESVIAFVVAFFVPYFAFTAIEGSFLHALGRGMGNPA